MVGALKVTRNQIQRFIQSLPDDRFFFFGPQQKVAQVVGISETRLSKIINRHVEPRYAEIIALTRFFEQQFHRSIDPREVYDVAVTLQPLPAAKQPHRQSPQKEAA